MLWRVGEGVGKPEFCLPLLHGKISFHPPSAVTGSGGVNRQSRRFYFNFKNHLIAFSFAVFLLSEIRKMRAKAAAVTDCGAACFSHTALASALKSQLVGSFQSFWGRIHRGVSALNP